MIKNASISVVERIMAPLICGVAIAHGPHFIDLQFDCFGSGLHDRTKHSNDS